MADISKITLPSGSTYDIKDAVARQSISDIESSITGAMHYCGITSTALTDGSTTATITIDGDSVTFTSSDAGSVVIYSEKEYVWNGTKWQEFGSTGSLKALAFKDSASGSYTPGGSVTPSVTLNTTTVNSITDVGTLPSFTATVNNEKLTLSWSTGTLPTKGNNTTVATGVQSATASFTGTAGTVTVS